MTQKNQPQHSIMSAIEHRWSPRSFSEKPILEEDVYRLLEAARWAPSCFNEQPWGFLVACSNQPQAFNTMLACLVEGNQIWAKNASVLMISTARTTFKRNNNPNRYAMHDTGLAVGQMAIQAQSMGIYMHQMGGIHLDLIRETYQLPTEVEPVAGIALGYLGDAQHLPEELKQRELAPGERKTQQEFAFTNTWGQTFSA